MAEAKKTTKKTAKTKAVKDAEQQVSSETTEKIAEIIEAETIAEAIIEAQAEIDSEEPKTAKAGKRSAKAAQEAEAKQAKATKKTEVKTDDAKAKPAPIARSKVDRAGKKYREAAKLVDSSKNYSLPEALELVKKTSPTKFDATVELHINLGVDPKQADQNVRDTVVLPGGTGKTVRIAVLAEPEDAAKAKAAGADITDADSLFAALDKEDIGFDVLIAVPLMMAKLGKYARLLGPRGLMPNPKSGTVTANVAEAVAEAKAGRVEYRVDQAGIIHLGIGKASFTPEKLRQNADAVLSSVKSAKPASVKGIYLKSAYITSSMGPSIKLDIQTS